MAELRFTVSGPRWARFDETVEDFCFRNEIQCQVTRRTSWLREHIRVTLIGEAEKLAHARDRLHRAIEEYNRE